MSVSSLTDIPEQGQIAAVRQRRFTVVDVQPSTLPPSLLTGQAAPQHLVTLTSIEDDALGESLQVVWELEPGARISEKVELPEPTGFDPPERLNAFLDAVRWGAIASADVRALQAPFRSGIELEELVIEKDKAVIVRVDSSCKYRYLVKLIEGLKQRDIDRISLKEL